MGLVLLFLPLLLFNEFPGLVRDIDNESESDGEQRQDVERCSEDGEDFQGVFVVGGFLAKLVIKGLKERGIWPVT